MIISNISQRLQEVNTLLATCTQDSITFEQALRLSLFYKDFNETKGKVENAVKYVKYNFLRGRTFENIGRLNEEAARWLSRTANGLPHNTTRLIPDDVFELEKGYLMPYTGKAMMPERAMREYTVYKTNIIGYKGNSYSLPNGSYQGPGTKVWVNEKEERLEIYSKDTGKLLVTHLLSRKKGEYILDPSHRKVHFIQADKLESKILEYSGYDNLALTWMLNLKKEKPRYYNLNLRMLAPNMEHFEVATLHLVFSKCIDAGMYNAKEFLMLCNRVGKRKVAINSNKTSNVTARTEIPDKTPISSYNQYFS